MRFSDWKLLVESLDPQQIVNTALQVRKLKGVCTRAKFGDCKELSEELMKMLLRQGVQARMSGGTFITKPKDDESWEHSWLVINNRWVLDVTIDQFFSDLDVDMHTKTPGIYFSHPNWDGNVYKDRYYRARSLGKIQM